MQYTKITNQDTINIKEKITNHLHILIGTDNSKLDSIFYNITKVIFNPHYSDVLLYDNTIYNDLLYIYNSFGKITKDEKLIDEILNKTIDIQIKFFSYEKNLNKKNSTQSTSEDNSTLTKTYDTKLKNKLDNKSTIVDKNTYLTNNVMDNIIKKYKEIIHMESEIKDLLNFYDQKNIDDLKNKINDLRLATKNISTDDIDNLNYMIRESKNKANEIENLESKLQQKLNNLDSKNIENLLQEYSTIEENFKNNILIMTSEIEEYKNKSFSQLDSMLSNCKTTFDDNLNNFNKIYNKNNEKFHNLYNQVTSSLDNLNNEINKEQLAQYFQAECKKLKGHINPFIVSFSLFIATILYPLIFKVFIDNGYKETDNLFTSLIIFSATCFLSLIITQLIFNIFSFLTNNNIQNEDTKLKKLCNIINRIIKQDTIKELLTPYWCWLIFIFIGMYLIGSIAHTIYNDANQIKNIYNMLPKTPIFMIMVWFTWFSSKQFSYTKQICDEYEYKYALSKSYLSYKNEAIALSNENKSLLVALLDSVIRNISTSPVQSVKSDCHTPFSEVLNSAKNAADLINKDKTKNT